MKRETDETGNPRQARLFRAFHWVQHLGVLHDKRDSLSLENLHGFQKIKGSSLMIMKGVNMRTLIVEDEFGSRKLLQGMLASFGECDLAVNGQEAVEAFKAAWTEGNPYDLILMDILMPVMDGQAALEAIRSIEKQMGIIGSQEAKVIMVTALGDPKTVVEAFYKGGATSYIVKPIDHDKLLEEMRKVGLLQ